MVDLANASASELEQAIKAREAVEPAAVAQEQDKSEPKVDGQSGNAAGTQEATEQSSYDYKKGYDNLRSWNTRMAQEVSELKRTLDEVRAARKERQPETPQLTRDQLVEWQDRDPIGFGQWMATQVAEAKNREIRDELERVKAGFGEMTARSTVERFRSQYPDFKDLEGEIREEVATFPTEMQSNPRYYDVALDTAYWKVKGKQIKEAEDRAREQGRAEANAKARQKDGAFVEGSGKASSEQPLDLNRMSSAELYKLMEAKGIVQK